MMRKKNSGFRFILIALLCAAAIGVGGGAGTTREVRATAAPSVSQRAAVTQWPRATVAFSPTDKFPTPAPTSTRRPWGTPIFQESTNTRATAATVTAPPLDTSRYRSLEEGDQGEDVLALKERLAQLGYFSTSTVFSKTYSTATANAVSQFQRDHGLVSSGIADPRTQALMFSDVLDKAAAGALMSGTAGTTKRPAVQTKRQDGTEANASVNTEAAYIGNSNTNKFHRPSCASVKQMKDSHKVPLSSRETAINKGYVPCKRCNP